MLSGMSLGHSFRSPALEPVGNPLPWQFRVRPALFVAVTSIVTVLLAIGGLFLARRLTGALNTNLPPQTMLLLALAAAATLAFSRIAWRRSFPLETPEDLSATDRLFGWASSAALLLLAIGCSYPAYQTTDWLIWLPLLVADQFWRQNFFDAGEPWLPSSEIENDFLLAPTQAIFDIPERAPPQLTDPQRRASPPTLFKASGSREMPNHQPLLGHLGRAEKNIVQQLFRLQDEQGHDVIYGTVRADFIAGQRTAVVHVGFCPPLTYLPEIEAEALPSLLLQDSQAKIKVVQALAHGTRLDIRLPNAAPRDSQLWIDMAARPEAA